MMKVKIGTKFRSALADSNPLWEVTRKLGRSVWEATVVNEPFEYEGRLIDSDFVGTTRAFRARDITASLKTEALWAGLRKKHDDYYAGLKPGEIVHYDDGFQAYVRCEVVEDGGENKLRPIALVGEWKSYDLGPDAYFPRKIEAGDDLFRPNVSTIYEASGSVASKRAKTNPAELEPIRLTGQQLSLGAL